MALAGAVALSAAVWMARPDAAAVGTHFVHLKVRPGVSAAIADASPLLVRADAPEELTRWQRVPVRGTALAARALAERLGARADVEVAFVAPVPALPLERVDRLADACPIRTPSYEPYQGYLAEAPGGINAPAAWARPGGRGEAVWFADVEGGWNARHEDLPGSRMVSAGGRELRGRDWQAHGTAVLGEVVGRDNGIGMVGIAPDVERVVTSAIGGISPAAAIDLAAARLRPGDVLLIELHAIGPRGRFLPMEFWPDVYEVVRHATSRGIVVVAAAGNGAENLDHPDYGGRMERAVRDSGAILVGAGAPNASGWVDRSRLDFSNYGSRVDVQGWGRMVATLDYGDLQDCDANDRKYTRLFAGTSSASPVVAGAALLVQSVYKTQTGKVLAPRELRAVLARTGSPQTSGPHGPVTERIGPRPDVGKALEALGL